MAKHVLIWLVLVVVIMGVIQSISSNEMSGGALDYTTFVNKVIGGEVRSVNIKDGHNITGKMNNGSGFSVVIPVYDGKLLETLREHNVQATGEFEESSGFLSSVLISWMPVILLVGVWIYFMRQMQGGGKATSFGKSKARMLAP